MSRIEDLEKRLAKDPQSKIFAQLAEEYRKAGLLEDAINTCREGLRIHPNYFSARVALGRALLEASSNEEAATEFEKVLQMVPDNILANKFLAETYHRMGRFQEALAKYQVAGMLAPGDTDIGVRLEQVKRDMDSTRRAAPPPPPVMDDTAFDASDFEPSSDGVEESASLPAESEPSGAGLETGPAMAHPEIGPSEEQVFELKETGGGATETDPNPPPTLAGQMGSLPLSEEARGPQEEFEQGPTTGVVARQSSEIRDTGPAPAGREIDSRVPVPTPPVPPDTRKAASRAPVRPELIIEEREERGERPAAAESGTPGSRIGEPAPPSASEPSAGASSGGLTSATLAELYASQGHLEQAVEVYRGLLSSRPNDPKIVQRIEELEMLVRASAEVTARPASRAQPVSSSAVREIEKTIRILEGWLTAIQKS